MKYTNKEIKKGINLHTIENQKFKTNLIAIFLSTPLNRENVTKNALIPAILRRGTSKMKTQEEISKALEEMYGATFDCGIDKKGDNQILKFYLESINDEYLPNQEENILKQSINTIIEIIFNPLIEENHFKQEYILQEKQNLEQLIKGKIDNKSRYAYERCIEEMYKNQNYGLYKYGYIEDLNQINETNLYEYYKNLIKECKIDIFISGNIEESIENIIKENETIKKLEERTPKYIKTSEKNKNENKEINEVEEKMDVTQGKLIIGLDLELENEKSKYDSLIYNSILGGSANSKLFQNVREKNSLAYTASSSLLKTKNNIFINCGIEIQNYEKALEIIKQQLEDLKNGDFTDEEVENAKKGIISAIKLIDDEQDTEILYYFGQEFTDKKTSLEEYENIIRNVKKQDVIDVANKVKINTIYFLRN